MTGKPMLWTSKNSFSGTTFCTDRLLTFLAFTCLWRQVYFYFGMYQTLYGHCFEHPLEIYVRHTVMLIARLNQIAEQ
jgi:hypothetical protein